ncbi:MAG: substrate-binding domain-containing protein [Rikenellaceae bacterium]|nr:substrate-binding domain-containing protein [Rikenellaceae bacterium]
MKKLVTVALLSAILCVSCGREKSRQYLIGVSQCSDDAWRKTMNDEMLREVLYYHDIDLSLDIRTVSDDTPRQIRDIEELIERGVDLLVVSPNEAAAITPVVRRAFDNGIPVILFDRKIDTEDYTAYVGADNYQLGLEAGHYAAEVLSGEGNIVVMRGWNGSTSDSERYAGFIDGIGGHEDIAIVAERWGNFLQEEARQQMDQVMDECGHIDLVFAMNDPMALGVHGSVTRYSGKRPVIIGVDALPGIGMEYIRRGLVDASFIYPTGGDKVVDLAVKILTGKSFERENRLGTAVVDRNNVRTIILQTEQISEQQAKLESLFDLLDKSTIRYDNQRSLFYATIAILLLISVLLAVTVVAYRSKSRVNALLAHQNAEIRQQAEILQSQKEQLITLSARLEEATQAKLVFFTNISHEFRTPLTLIMGPVESLLAADNLSPSQREMLSLVSRNSSRLLRLISQIIEFRTIENEKMQLSLSGGDILSFLKELNVVLADYAARLGVSFKMETDTARLEGVFDREKLEKIYYNLLSNAFKHTPAGGRIRVEVRPSVKEGRKCMVLRVYNSGDAIPADKIKNIFNRFYKVSINDSGTGIGLALTSALVDVLEGSIEVESIDGVGTTFTVILPVEYPSRPVESPSGQYDYDYSRGLFNAELLPALEKARDQEDPGGDKPLILVVEDNVDMQKYLLSILRAEYRILQAYNGEEGLEKAVDRIPDAVISDVMMGGKDGFEVCRRLKGNILTSHIPVILLTACALDEQKAEGFESGADAYIPKPFNPQLLTIRLRKLIENRRRMKETFADNYITGERKAKLAGLEQQFLKQFRDYVEANMEQPELNIDTIAAHLGISRAQLYRKLKSVTSYSPNDLISVIRLKRAIGLLKEGKSISEAAYETGFSSPSYFTKAFKKYYRQSPSEFLKKDG